LKDKIYWGIKNRISIAKLRLKTFWFKSYLKNPHYMSISNSDLFINFIFQRIARKNHNIPFSVSFTTKIQGFENIILPSSADSIKLSFALSGGCYFAIFDNSSLTIGEGTIWAHNVCIQTGNHGLLNRDDYNIKSIVIGKNCWIGNSVTILPGVQLGDNVTIGANSVVTKSFPSNVVIGGCPAQIIKKIF
jgi:maltose O-acetyltransferase